MFTTAKKKYIHIENMIYDIYTNSSMVLCALNMIMAELAGGKVDHKYPDDFKYFVPLVHILLIFFISATRPSLWSQTQLLPSLYMFEGRQSSVPCCIFSYTCRTSQSY